MSPYCPRHVFVHEGLLAELQPTADELAFLISHEISHVVHAHGNETMQRTAIAAQVLDNSIALSIHVHIYIYNININV